MDDGEPKLVSDFSYVFSKVLVYPIILEGGVMSCIMSLNKSNRKIL